jgi:hypothetical protein
MAASKPLASAELVDAGESAAARGTGELAETLGSIEQPKRYNDKAQSNDKEQRTLNSLFRCKRKKTHFFGFACALNVGRKKKNPFNSLQQ